MSDENCAEKKNMLTLKEKMEVLNVFDRENVFMFSGPKVQCKKNANYRKNEK